MKQRFFAILATIAIAVSVSGCGGSHSRSATDRLSDTTGGGNGTWTVLVYMNSDNDLERYGILNFNQMEKVGSTNNVKIVVQMDRSPGFDSTNGNWTGTRRYLVQKDNDPDIITSPVVQDMGEVDMGSPDTLREFIRWGEATYPADHYCLVIWNHGSGWRSRQLSAVAPISRDISFDDTSNTSIKTVDLPYALSGSDPVDIVTMDACLMQMLEVAYEIRNCAQVMVASEEDSPGDGYEYSTWLAPLAANPGMSAHELGTTIAREYIKTYTNSYDATQSAIDLTKIQNVAAATDDLATAIIPHIDSDASLLRTARQNAQAYSFDYYKDLIDYGSLVNQLIPDQAITSAMDNLRSALTSATIYEGHTGSGVDRSHGLSINMPSPSDSTYDDNITKYKTLSFTHDYPAWDQLVSSQKF